MRGPQKRALWIGLDRLKCSLERMRTGTQARRCVLKANTVCQKNSANPSCNWEIGLFPRSLKIRFDFLQSLPLGFRQEHCGSDEIDYGAAGKAKKHCRGPVLADGRQEHGGNGR